MENKKTDLGIHLPAPRLTVVLDIVVASQVPLTILFAAPKQVVGFRVSRLDLARLIRSMSSSYASIFECNILRRGIGETSGVLSSVIHIGELGGRGS